jgi:hypothetical protein
VTPAFHSPVGQQRHQAIRIVAVGDGKNPTTPLEQLTISGGFLCGLSGYIRQHFLAYGDIR